MPSYINPPAKLLRHMDRIAALRNGSRQAPVNVEIDLSNRCSLGCEWCHFAHTHARGPLAHKRTVDTGDLMDALLIHRIMPELADYGVRSLVWSGGGEPTLHPAFEAIVTTCPLPQGVYTNGTALHERNADTMKARMTWVYVSLDAASGEEYAACKGVPAKRFEDACEGIRLLVAAHGKATVGVGFLLNAENWHTAARMATLGAELGADYVQFRPVVRYDVDTPSQRSGDASWISKAARTLESLSVRGGVQLNIERFNMLRDWCGHGYYTCWWSGLQTVITPDGRVWACLNKRGHEDAALGNLNTETFRDIWQRAPLQTVNEQCRVMCRGHIPNLTLDQMMHDVPHGEFI